MNKAEILEFLKKCDSEIDSHGMHIFFSVDAGLQQKSVVDLDEMAKKVNSVLEISQGQNFEILSNLLMGFICHIRSIQSELRAYLHMKGGDMSAAWDAIVDARNASCAATRANSMYVDVCKVRISRLDEMEKLLFPPQLFLSVGGVAKSSECSICNADYRNCNHVAGRIYNGKFCSRIITKMDLNEVSVVKDPVDRRCRAISFPKGNEHFDALTLRKTNKKGEDENSESQS